jgi:hypothetical protein
VLVSRVVKGSRGGDPKTSEPVLQSNGLPKLPEIALIQ